MADDLQAKLRPTADSMSDSAQLGRMLRRLGGIGFWTQILIAVVPVIVITLAFSAVYGVRGPLRSAGFLGLLSFISFLILLATTFWCWRYRRIGARLTGGETVDEGRLGRMIWVGLFLTASGIVLSMIVILSEMIYLLIRFLEAPQGGVPVIQTTEGSASWISAVDILGLMTLILTLSGEIVALVVSLWMLSRVTSRSRRAVV